MRSICAVVARILIAGLLMSLVSAAAAQQSSYPNKRITIILPYAPGGGTTPLARMVGQHLTERWGQPVIVDNRGGANTIIGSNAVAKSAADGYTFLLTTSTLVVVPLLAPTPFDAIKDFVPVATVSSSEFVLVLNPSVPARDYRELIALARSNPGKLNYASAGAGGVSHLAGELFNLLADVRMQHVPYKGAGPGVTDLLGGQVQASFQSSLNVIPHIKAGRLRAIAISGEQRLSNLPNVPTFSEVGLSDFDVKTWFGLLAPARTPKDIIDKVSSEINTFLSTTEVKEKLLALGMDPFITTPERFAEIMRADTDRYARVIKSANIKLDN